MRIFYETYIFSLGTCWWVSFLGSFLWGIHSHTQKCDSEQKVRAHSALLGTCAHFHAYLHFLPQMDGDGCHFRVIFSGEFISEHKNTIECKKCARTQALLGTYALFLYETYIFSLDSCSWVSYLGYFWWGINSHTQKCDSEQKVRARSALLGTCAHFHV